MSTAMNEGVQMRCKAVMVNFFIVVDPLVEPSSTDLKNPKGYIEASLSIS